jgi:hypothetical protein
METRLKAVAYAKQLKARLEELQAQRKKDLKKYEEDLSTWRGAMIVWLRGEGVNRIVKMPKSKLQEERRWSSGSPGFASDAFFAGAPKVPACPSDKPILKIRALLRQLAISGQEHITVSTKDVEEYLIGTEAYE